jgi:aminoglycoside phosphotransferase (APT) family kinase protein
LFDLYTAPEIDCQAVSSTGAALAALHAQSPEGLGCSTRADEAADLVELAAEIGFICPGLAARADEFSRRLAAKLAAAPAMHCAIHGDFSAKQVLVGQPASSIVDLDWAGRGDPAGDLGNFIAQAERHALQGALSPDRVELLREALLEGYGQRSDRRLAERIELYTAVELFRRTRYPFRVREFDWLARTEELLERAGTLLNRLN